MEQNVKTIGRNLVFFAIVFAVFTGCKTVLYAQHSTSEWKPLMNGKDLTGWDTYLGAVYDTLTGKQTGAPLGINTDPRKVFSVVKVDNRPALRISGQDFGGI